MTADLGRVAEAIYQGRGNSQQAVLDAIGIPDRSLWPAADELDEHFCAYRVLAWERRFDLAPLRRSELAPPPSDLRPTVRCSWSSSGRWRKEWDHEWRLHARRARCGRGIALVRRVELRSERAARPTLRAIAARQPPGRPASSSGRELAVGDGRRTGALLRTGRRLPRQLPMSIVREASARGAGLPARRGVGTTPPMRSARSRRGRARPRRRRAASGCRVVGSVWVVVVIRGRCA